MPARMTLTGEVKNECTFRVTYIIKYRTAIAGRIKNF
jgi:hypothetical protein